MTDPNEELPVADFFSDEDAIGLIARIDREHGNIKTELVNKVNLTSKPVRNLIEDAIKLDLIEETIRAGDHGRADRYQLTERGKAVQSMLRTMGLDETHREYLESKRELEGAVPDVQVMIEEAGLHNEYVQQDFWSRSDFDTEELDREKLLQQMEQKEQNSTESTRNRVRDRDDLSVDILDDESEAEDDLNPKETWGTPEEEDDNEGD